MTHPAASKENHNEAPLIFGEICADRPFLDTALTGPGIKERYLNYKAAYRAGVELIRTYPGARDKDRHRVEMAYHSRVIATREGTELRLAALGILPVALADMPIATPSAPPTAIPLTYTSILQAYAAVPALRTHLTWHNFNASPGELSPFPSYVYNPEAVGAVAARHQETFSGLKYDSLRPGELVQRVFGGHDVIAQSLLSGYSLPEALFTNAAVLGDDIVLKTVAAGHEKRAALLNGARHLLTDVQFERFVELVDTPGGVVAAGLARYIVNREDHIGYSQRNVPLQELWRTLGMEASLAAARERLLGKSTHYDERLGERAWF